MKEERVVIRKGEEMLVTGYFLLLDDLQRLIKDYKANIDFVNDDRAYIANWLNQNT